MAEVGLLRFAKVALAVGSAVLPQYRSKFSKHTYTQPQMLAALLLMKFEDWTFRETEVRLSEHKELRKALGLSRVPDYTSLYLFMRRLDKQTVDAALAECVMRMPGPPSGGAADRAVLAVDGTGLETTSVSTYFIKRTNGGKRRRYLKLVAGVDTQRLMFTSVEAHEGPTNDTALLPQIVGTAARIRPVSLVLADAEFDSNANHFFIRVGCGAFSVIPAKRNKKSRRRPRGYRIDMRARFPAHLYGARALAETAFSTVKRKLSDRAPGRLLQAQQTQAFLLALAYNIYRLKLWLFSRPVSPQYPAQLSPT
jgi:hypothetical protein